MRQQNEAGRSCHEFRQISGARQGFRAARPEARAVCKFGRDRICRAAARPPGHIQIIVLADSGFSESATSVIIRPISSRPSHLSFPQRSWESWGKWVGQLQILILNGPNSPFSTCSSFKVIANLRVKGVPDSGCFGSEIRLPLDWSLCILSPWNVGWVHCYAGRFKCVVSRPASYELIIPRDVASPQ